jgi:hypothetical protein
MRMPPDASHTEARAGGGPLLARSLGITCVSVAVSTIYQSSPFWMMLRPISSVAKFFSRIGQAGEQNLYKQAFLNVTFDYNSNLRSPLKYGVGTWPTTSRKLD